MLKILRIWICIWMCFVCCLLERTQLTAVLAVPLEYVDDHEQLSYDMDTEQSKVKYDPRLLSEQLLPETKVSPTEGGDASSLTYNVAEEQQQQHHRHQPTEEDDDLQPHERAASCFSSGRKYTHGQKVPREDPCEVCLCVDGEIFCWWKKCGIPRKKFKTETHANPRQVTAKSGKSKRLRLTTLKTTEVFAEQQTARLQQHKEEDEEWQHSKRQKQKLEHQEQYKNRQQQQQQQQQHEKILANGVQKNKYHQQRQQYEQEEHLRQEQQQPHPHPHHQQQHEEQQQHHTSHNKILNFPENLPSVLYFDYKTEEHQHHQHQHHQQHLKRQREQQQQRKHELQFTDNFKRIATAATTTTTSMDMGLPTEKYNYYQQTPSKQQQQNIANIENADGNEDDDDDGEEEQAEFDSDILPEPPTKKPKISAPLLTAAAAATTTTAPAITMTATNAKETALRQQQWQETRAITQTFNFDDNHLVKSRTDNEYSDSNNSKNSNKMTVAAEIMDTDADSESSSLLSSSISQPFSIDDTKMQSSYVDNNFNDETPQDNTIKNMKHKQYGKNYNDDDTDNDHEDDAENVNDDDDDDLHRWLSSTENSNSNNNNDNNNKNRYSYNEMNFDATKNDDSTQPGNINPYAATAGAAVATAPTQTTTTTQITSSSNKNNKIINNNNSNISEHTKDSTSSSAAAVDTATTGGGGGGAAAYFRSTYNDFSSEFNGSVVNIDILLTADQEVPPPPVPPTPSSQQQQLQSVAAILRAAYFISNASKTLSPNVASAVGAANNTKTKAASSSLSSLPMDLIASGDDGTNNQNSTTATTLTPPLPPARVTTWTAIKTTTSLPEKQCNVMGTLYKIGDVLPQETGNCLQCICIDGSTKDDTPRVTCSPHNCPPLVLPDLFDATGY